MNITLEQYIGVLRAEAEILRKDYFNRHAEGTGHFNTAASVLDFRIKELEKKGIENEFVS